MPIAQSIKSEKDRNRSVIHEQIEECNRVDSLTFSEKNDRLEQWLRSIETPSDCARDEQILFNSTIFINRMIAFCNSTSSEMIASERTNQNMWSALNEDQKLQIQREISQKVESLEIIVNEITVTEYIRNAFIQTERTIVSAISDKQFLFSLFPGFDDFIRINSKWFTRALLAVFECLVDSISSRCEGEIVFEHFKQYLIWINASEKFNKFEARWCMLNGAIQGLLLDGHPILDLYPIVLRDFLRWWFRVTGFRFAFHSSGCGKCGKAIRRFQSLRVDNYPHVKAQRSQRIHATD